MTLFVITSRDDFCEEIEVEEQDHTNVHTLPLRHVQVYWQITLYFVTCMSHYLLHSVCTSVYVD